MRRVRVGTLRRARVHWLCTACDRICACHVQGCVRVRDVCALVHRAVMRRCTSTRQRYTATHRMFTCVLRVFTCVYRVRTPYAVVSLREGCWLAHAHGEYDALVNGCMSYPGHARAGAHALGKCARTSDEPCNNGGLCRHPCIFAVVCAGGGAAATIEAGQGVFWWCNAMFWTLFQPVPREIHATGPSWGVPPGRIWG